MINEISNRKFCFLAYIMNITYKDISLHNRNNDTDIDLNGKFIQIQNWITNGYHQIQSLLEIITNYIR